MRIPISAGDHGSPHVAVTPYNTRQIRVSINSALARAVHPERFKFVTLEIDGPIVTLTLTNKPRHKEVVAHKLLNDGAKSRGLASRMILVRAASVKAAGEKLPLGRYVPIKLSAQSVTFDTRKKMKVVR
jgi:hypothetical protein